MNDTFVATVVTAVATLLGILLAAITAYFVFQRERTADFSKETFDETLAIRDHLQSFQKTGAQIEMLMPVRFMEKVRFDRRTKPRADLLRPLASAIDVHLEYSLKLEGVFREFDRYRGPWRGRAYYLLLREAAYQVAPQLEPWRPKQYTFPTLPVEVGFTQWRKIFEKVYDATRDSVGSRERAIEDFRSFDSQRTDREFLPNAENIFLEWISTFSSTMERVRSGLGKIDKLDQSFKNHSYALERKHVAWLYLLCLASFVCGVVVPLSWQARMSSQAIAVLVASLGTTALAFALFGFAVVRSAKSRDKDEAYADLQWCCPLRYDMKDMDFKLDNYGQLDLDFACEARSSGDLNGPLLDALQGYIVRAEDYNVNAAGFDRMVVELFRSRFPEAASRPNARWGLLTSDVLRPDKIAEAVVNLRGQPDAAFGILTVSRKGPGSDPPQFVFSVGNYTENDLRAKLETIVEIARQDPVTAELERTHKLVHESRGTLRDHLPDVQKCP